MLPLFNFSSGHAVESKNKISDRHSWFSFGGGAYGWHLWNIPDLRKMNASARCKFGKPA